MAIAAPASSIRSGITGGSTRTSRTCPRKRWCGAPGSSRAL